MNSVDLVAQAKQRLPLPALMAQLGFGDRAKKSARCLFHDDSSASFSLYFDGDGEENWKCFAGCGQGDAIDFLATLRGLSNADARREYIRLAGASAPQTSVRPEKPFDWSACTAAFTPEHRQKLAQWHGYSPRFIDWLHTEKLIGLFDGERIAFPVNDARGNVVGCHYRRKEDGSWRYHPTGTHTTPFVIGNLAPTKSVFAFESPWDLLSVLDSLHHYIEPLSETATIATRGAGNGKLIAGLCTPDASVYAFAQNDGPGQKWLASIPAHSARKAFHVVTPAPHKDTNDWTRAGAVADDIRKAIAEALPVQDPAVTDLHAAPPRNVSKPAIAMPPEETEDADDTPPPFPVDALPPAMAP